MLGSQAQMGTLLGKQHTWSPVMCTYSPTPHQPTHRYTEWVPGDWIQEVPFPQTCLHPDP